MKNFWQLSGSLLLLTIVLVGSVAGLAQFKFSSFLSESIRERLDIVASTAAEDFGAAIDLGLGLGEVANGAAILERARSHDPTISSIIVFDADGRVLHAVGEVDLGQIESETRRQFATEGFRNAGDEWGIETDDIVAAGTPITGGFGQVVGGVLVVYPKIEMRQQQGVMAAELAASGIAVGAALGLSVLVLVLIFRRRVAPNERSHRFDVGVS